MTELLHRQVVIVCFHAENKKTFINIYLILDIYKYLLDKLLVCPEINAEFPVFIKSPLQIINGLYLHMGIVISLI